MKSVMVLALAVVARAGAQVTPDLSARSPRRCAGEMVTAIDIQSHSSVPSGSLENMSPATSRAMRSHFPTTRADVVRAYLRVGVGRACLEIDRTESERLLRAQPFIAAAVVRVLDDGEGRVRLQVDVVDELPVIAGGSLSRGRVASLMLGSLNFMGRGLAVTAQATRGFAYRNGFGVRAVQYGIFGAPHFVAIEGERRPLGEILSFEFADPFSTALQRHAFRFAVRQASGYFSVTPDAGPDIALKGRRISYGAGWVNRVGTLDRHHTAGFLGAAILGESTRLHHDPTIVSDTGLVPALNAEFGSEYPELADLRVAGIGGVRSVHFMPVRGFDALAAAQDVGVGIQLHVLAGPSVWAQGHAREVFAAGEVYAGMGNERSFASVHAISEGRGDYRSSVWSGMVSSARISWYTLAGRYWTRIVSVDAAAVRHLDVPAQLTFRDFDGGVVGYTSSRAAGGFRSVARVEQRRRTTVLGSRADVAVSVFAIAGKLWAGDVPYGQTTNVRAALGLSLLAAYPSGGKRTYRVDVAFPLNPERGGARVELRVSAIDRTRFLWLEPRDVARVRTGSVPTNLMKW
ncbi:MAG TPA: hypothetical protein VE967_00590 [Gemmatimonadaceae bacterium]|nr:hypothetical protein [Gemmatimonadaceae bacterium]